MEQTILDVPANMTQTQWSEAQSYWERTRVAAMLYLAREEKKQHGRAAQHVVNTMENILFSMADLHNPQ